MHLPESRLSFLASPLRALGLLSALALGALPFAAQAASPRLNSCYPAGGQRGTEVETIVSGSALNDVRTLLFNDPGIEVVSCAMENNRLKAKLKIAPDAHLGEHRFRAVTESGISEIRVFFVTPFPLVEEQKKVKADSRTPQPIALNTTVYGTTPNDDQDRYLVELKKGQRLTAEVIGRHLQGATLYDPAIAIEREDGTELVESDDTAFGRQDPIASIVAPEDGKYVVMIRESTNVGNNAQYLMHVGTFAQPLAVYPPGGPAGEEIKVKLLGDASGPIEKSVKLPAEPDPKFAIQTDVDGAAPIPNAFRVSKFPNVLENEPNNDVEHATTGPEVLPLAVNGVIEQKGDVDFFKITAKKGAPYDVRVYARVLRSPLDSVLTIYNEKGNKLTTNDDVVEPDSYLRWSAPADGTYYISVTDQLNRGSSIYTYRVEITPVEAKVHAYLPEITQNQNQDRRAIVVPKGNRYASLVRVKRADFAGDLNLEPIDLPIGVKAHFGPLDKSVDTIAMVFEADPDAVSDQKLVVLNPKPTEEPKDGQKVITGVSHLVDLVGGGNEKPYYTVNEEKIAAAVVEPIPVKITLAPFKAPILANGSMNLKIKAERSGDFKGPISLSLLYVPPGIGSSVVTIKEGQTEVEMPLSANATSPVKSWKICVVGNADFGKGNQFFSTELRDLEVAPAIMDGQIQRTFVDQGDSTTVIVKLTPKAEFEGKAKLELMGLPGGVTAEPQEITKETTEVKFEVKANDKAIVGQHRQLFCQFRLAKDGEEMLNTFGLGGVLRVDKGTIAKNTETK